MREKILTFIEKNSRIDTQELAVILGVDETAVMNELEAMEQEGIICGYHTLINWDKAGVEKVTALIEVRVTPQRGMGFDKVAERIYNYPEVNSVYLISGGFDLMVTLEGKTLREISQFVSDKLSAGDKIHGIYFRIIVNALCNLIKSHAALRCHTHFNQCSYFFHTGFVPVNQRMISADNSLLLHSFQLIHDCCLIYTENYGQLLCIDAAVFFYKS
jgi:DNA-binding Lrp family transcriptional regulator